MPRILSLALGYFLKLWKDRSSFSIQTKIKFFFVSCSVWALLGDIRPNASLDGIISLPWIFSTRSFLLLFFSFFFASIFSLPFLFPTRKHGLKYIWLPLLFALLCIRINIIASHPKGAPSLPKAWTNPKTKALTLYAKAKVQKVFRPSVYLLRIEFTGIKNQEGYIRFSKKNSLKMKKYKELKGFLFYTNLNDYYIYEGCHLKIKLYDSSLPRKPSLDSSFGNYLNRQGIQGIIRLKRQVNILSKNCRQIGLRGSFQRAISRIFYESGFSFYQGGTAAALLLGRSGYMPRKLKNKASGLGILHLFAASGLHMGIFYMCFYGPLRRFYGKKGRLSLSLPLIPCFFYAYILGFPPSLLRAYIFICFHAMQSIFCRSLKTEDLLLNTAICVLFIDPLNFISLGCFLSFGAVSGIIYFYPLISTTLIPQSNHIYSNLMWGFWLKQGAVSLCAGIFTMPALLSAFGMYPYSSLVANMILVPLIGILMPLLIGGTSLYALSSGELSFPITAARWGIEIFIGVTQKLADKSLAVSYDSMFCLPLFANTFLLCCLLGLQYYGKESQKQKRTRSLLLFCAILCILLLSPLTGIVVNYLL